MANNLSKKCDTSLRVLQTLLFLTEQPASIQDILNYFKEKQQVLYTSKVILKYLNTLKVFGFRLLRNKNKYILLNAIPAISFSDDELEGLKLLANLSENIPESKIKKDLATLYEKLEIHFDNGTKLKAKNIKLNNNIQNSHYDKYKEIIKQYETYCEDKFQLRITYINRRKEVTIRCIPIEIKFHYNEVYLNCYDIKTANMVDIRLRDIKEVHQYPTMQNSNNYIFSNVTFKLKDRLAKAYKIKDGEKLFQSLPNGDIIISNNKEDREELLHRLLRYGSFCEVLSPMNFRDEMKELITSTLKLYEN